MQVNRLRLSGVDRGDDCELIVFVDGQDLLLNLDAMGIEPDEGLPLLSPADPPERVRLGRCGCGDSECGAVWVRISASSDCVVWDEWSSTLGDALPGPLQFDRASYDAELRAADTTRAWESPERRYARLAGRWVDAEMRSALSWRGLEYVGIKPADAGTVAVQLRAEYLGAKWSVFVILPAAGDPRSIHRLFTSRGPTAWPEVLWWGDNDAAAFQQPPMAGKRWRMWQPV